VIKVKDIGLEDEEKDTRTFKKSKDEVKDEDLEPRTKTRTWD